MRASRLVQLILVLQRRGKTTARQLAAELEVSVRTVYRDVEALSGIGVPIYADSGPGGGVALLDGYETRLTGLTGPEASALGLAGVPEVAAQLGLRSVLLGAQAKVDAALPPELRHRALRLRERFLIDVPGWFERPEEATWLPELSAAVWDGRQVDVTYAGPQRSVRRRLHPLGLVLQGTTWYLVAAVHADDGGARDDGVARERPVRRRPAVRTYRVGRVLEVATREDPVARPPGFELASHWRTATAEFDRSIRPLPITIRLPRAHLHHLRHAVSPGAYQEALASAADDDGRHRSVGQGDRDEDERVDVRFHAESVDVAVHELLRLAGSVEAVDPPELRARLGQIGAALARRHGTG